MICQNISENLAKIGNEVTVLTTAFNQSYQSDTVDIVTPKKAFFCHPREGGDLVTLPQEPVLANVTQPKAGAGSLKLIRLRARRRKAFESNPVEMLSWISTTKSYIKNNSGFVDFDICMAHFVLPGGEVALWLKREYGLPYVLISHGHEIPWVHPRQMFILHLAAYQRIKKVCRESTLVFVQTQMMKANLDRFMGKTQAHKHVIIPNGADTGRFYPDYAKRPANLRIIFGGRLVVQKDPMTFLRAIHLFHKLYRDFEVHVPGDGKLRNKMERYVKKNGLTDHFKFLGRISPDRMLEEYQASHVMVAASLNEGMSIAALEALSCGVYVIATRASGYDEMIREHVNGEFINFRDPENLAEKLTDFVMDNRKERLIAETQLNEFRNAFSWHEVARRYLEFFLKYCSQ